jgi:ABC-type Fe3+/spermidine/putrescine transport system ATPase subunit
LRGDVREILRAAGTAAIFVTHDQDEALTLGDRMAVMVRGRVEQCAPPEVVYGEPATAFAATFVGVANLVHGECHASTALTRFGRVRLVGPRAARAEGRALVVLRPEHLDLLESPDGPAGPDAWRVLRRQFAGTEILYEVVAGDGERLWVEAGPGVRRLRVGDTVTLRLRDVETVAFPTGHGSADAGPAEAPAPDLPTPAVPRGS